MCSYKIRYTLCRKLKTLTKIFCKALVAVLFIPFVIFITALRIFSAIYRFAAVPFLFLAAGMAAYFCCSEGFSLEYFQISVGIALSSIFYFLLPYILIFLDIVKEAMKNYLMTPIFIKPPVRYTL